MITDTFKMAARVTYSLVYLNGVWLVLWNGLEGWVNLINSIQVNVNSSKITFMKSSN